MRVPATLTALSLLIVACGGGGDATPADDAAAAPEPAPVQTASAGETTYQQVCITCHQADGKGLPPSFPPLAGSATLTGAPEMPIAIVLHGMQGEIVREGVTYNGVMTAWSMLSDEQIAEVLTYARSNFGNSAGAVTTEQVAAVRAATAGRAGAWTEAELMAATLK
jgi:mono/diheme cytochrome c family protein